MIEALIFVGLIIYLRVTWPNKSTHTRHQQAREFYGSIRNNLERALQAIPTDAEAAMFDLKCAASDLFSQQTRAHSIKGLASVFLDELIGLKQEISTERDQRQLIKQAMQHIDKAERASLQAHDCFDVRDRSGPLHPVLNRRAHQVAQSFCAQEYAANRVALKFVEAAQSANSLLDQRPTK